MDDKTLKKLQSVETEILVAFDKFCTEHDIKYSLYAGTALGAVRHGGFIPWDDDIDVCMSRDNYEKFLKVYRENEIEGYTLQGTDSPNYEYINFSKIRKNGTKYGGKLDMGLYENNGIYMDIFPIDKVPSDKKLMKKVLFYTKIRMVYTRGYAFTKGSAFLRLVSKMMLLLPRKTQLKIRNKYEKKILKYKDLKENFICMSLSCPEGLNIFYPQNMLDEYTTIKFGDREFSISTNWDGMLKANFGDYMKLPPEEDRICKHNAEILDFGDEE